MRTMQQMAVTRSSRNELRSPCPEPRDPLATLLPAGNSRYLRSSWSIEDLARCLFHNRSSVKFSPRLPRGTSPPF